MYGMFLWHQYLCPGNETVARKNKSKNRIFSNTGTWGGTVIESNNILFNLKNNKNHTHLFRKLCCLKDKQLYSLAYL